MRLASRQLVVAIAAVVGLLAAFGATGEEARPIPPTIEKTVTSNTSRRGAEFDLAPAGDASKGSQPAFSTGLGADARKGGTCTPRPKGIVAICDYYVHIAGTHSERWRIDFDRLEGRLFHPPHDCPQSRHARGGADVEYHSQPLSSAARARASVIWERRQAALEPSFLGGTIQFAVSLRRFAAGTAQYSVPPPAKCAGPIEMLDQSKCGTLRRFVRGDLETHEVRRGRVEVQLLIYLEPLDFTDCANVSLPLGPGPSTPPFAPSGLLRKSKFRLKASFSQSQPLKIAGRRVGEFVLKGSWTATFCEKGKVSPRDCRSELVANPGGPYSVERGGLVKLDGSASTGEIKSYTWTFSGGRCGGLRPNAGAKKLGKHARVRVLCPLTATLTVNDGRDSDSKSVAISVRPRRWKRKVEDVAEGQLREKLLYPCLICSFGRNVCSLDGADTQTSGHLLHPDRADKNGFDVAQVSDPNGPFDGKWYVSKYLLRVSRKSLINENLFPGTPLYDTNKKAFLETRSDTNTRYLYDIDKNGRADIDDLVASVRDHEGLHTTLMEGAWAKADPGAAVEKMVADSEGPLRADVESAIRTAATALEDATSETKVKERMRTKWNRPARILLPDPDGSGSYTSFDIPSLADVGDDPP